MISGFVVGSLSAKQGLRGLRGSDSGGQPVLATGPYGIAGKSIPVILAGRLRAMLSSDTIPGIPIIPVCRNGGTA